MGLTGKPGCIEILSDHRMFSLEKKRLWDFDGCFQGFRKLLYHYKKTIIDFFSQFQLTLWYEREKQIYFYVFNFFSANFGIENLKGSFLPSEHSSRNYLPKCPAHNSAQKRLPYVRNEKKSSLKKLCYRARAIV